MKEYANYNVRCTVEQKEEIALLVQQLKISSKEKMADVVLRALRTLKGYKWYCRTCGTKESIKKVYDEFGEYFSCENCAEVGDSINELGIFKEEK